MTLRSYESMCSVIVQSSWGKGDYFFHFAFLINWSKSVELLGRELQRRKHIVCTVKSVQEQR